MADTQPTEIIILTINTEAIRGKIHADYDAKGCELINSQGTYIAWHWFNAPAEDLTAIQALPGYLGTVPIPAQA